MAVTALSDWAVTAVTAHRASTPSSLRTRTSRMSPAPPLESLAASGVASAPWREGAAAALSACLKRMQDAAARGNVEECFFANVALTDVLHEQSGNPVLARLLAQVNTAALRYRHWAFCQEPSMITLSIDSNIAMVEAIRIGDPARAEKVTQELVREAWKLVRRTFGERG